MALLSIGIREVAQPGRAAPHEGVGQWFKSTLRDRVITLGVTEVSARYDREDPLVQ